MTEHLLEVKLEKGPIQFWAGQYLELLINNKAYAYSIASAPEDPEIILHIQFSKDHPGSVLVVDTLMKAKQVEVNAPIGAAYLRERSFKPILFVAGGTGIAPHYSMIQHLLHQNSKREIYLYWGGRQPEFLYLHNEFLNLSKALKNFHYVPVISGANDDWHGRKGLVHQAVIEDFKDLSPFEAYICGPFDMCFIAREDFAKQGLNRDNMYSDAFSFG